MYKFLLGDNGAWQKPAPDDEETPNVVNKALLDKSDALHDNELDSLNIPSGIEVVQVVGVGRDTIKNITYSCEYLTCNSLTTLNRELKQTTEGDGTVVYPSAQALDARTYYFDLEENNKKKNEHENREHSNIMGASKLKEFIRNVITNKLNNNNLPSYFSVGEPNGSGARRRIVLKSPVEIDVYDSDGKHTGLINQAVEGSDLRYYESEIPNSYYFESDGHKYVGVGDTDNEEYKIELSGQDLGTFTLEITDVVDDQEVNQDNFVDIPVTSETKGTLSITNNVVSNLSLDINGDQQNDIEVTPGESANKAVSLSVLKQVIRSLDISKPIKNILLQEALLAEKFQKMGNERLADKMLDQLQKLIKLYSNKRLPSKIRIDQDQAEKLIQIIEKIKRNW